MSSQTRPPVLICGAGPTGMLCSLWLTRYGVPHRLVDKAARPGTASRAIAMHARTLEFYRMLGLDEDLQGIGRRMEYACVVRNGIDCGGPPLAKGGQGLSAFPFTMTLSQDEHEEQLEKHLKKLGKHVERNVEVTAVDPPAEGEDRDVQVTLRHNSTGKEELFTASYVVACDGAHSTVRSAVGIEMDGGTYPGSFFVADVHSSSAIQMQGRLNFCCSRDSFMVHLPLPHKAGRARLIGFVPEELQEVENLSFEKIRPYIMNVIPNLEIDEVRWFAHYKSHHRCAERFQFGPRVFLCGDSAHIHSPVGGQGMNTGLGDASNLAWKLATAWHAGDENAPSGGVKGSSPPESHSTSRIDANALLATYEIERQPFARLLVNTTDRVFTSIVDSGWTGYMLRMVVFPYILPFVSKWFNVSTPMFKRLSQIAIAYPQSALSCNGAGTRRSAIQGSRLPWIEHAGATHGSKEANSGTDDDNHALLDGASWQAHLFTLSGSAEDVADVAERRWRMDMESILHASGVSIKAFACIPQAEKAGFLCDTIYLVRPDGHVGLAVDKRVQPEEVEAYLQRWGVGVFSKRTNK